MEISFGPKGMLHIDDARIIYRNFAGLGSKFNREGDRNFAVVIDDEDIYDELIADGWNVKRKVRDDDDDAPRMFLPVKVKFNERGPRAYLQSGGAKAVELDEESIDCLDEIDIVGVDLDIRPYNWEVNGKTGRTAYLQSIWVVQELDRFKARYEDME